MNDLLSNLNLELNNGIKQANTLYELYQLLSVYNVYINYYQKQKMI